MKLNFTVSSSLSIFVIKILFMICKYMTNYYVPIYVLKFNGVQILGCLESE